MMNDGTYLTNANWKHMKSSKVYHIAGFSTRESDGVTLVHYRDSNDSGAIVPFWTRPASEFFDGRFVRLFPGYSEGQK
jgi:hypothetical protein